jgi:hypothetical protein
MAIFLCFDTYLKKKKKRRLLYNKKFYALESIYNVQFDQVLEPNAISQVHFGRSHSKKRMNLEIKRKFN